MKEENGEALLLCDMIIDSQNFAISSNDYAESAIRAFLNEVFYETAFNELSGQIILSTTLENTEDKVFLLSVAEATAAEYGFSTDGTVIDDARRKKTTDYAQSQGAYTINSGLAAYRGDGWWWLRSPSASGAGSACGITTGKINDQMEVDYTCFGVVPAVWIRLN